MSAQSAEPMGETPKGVRIRVLTNSLASTDAPAAHAGYARYRNDLLGRFVLAENRFRIPFPQASVVIDHGEFEVFEGKML